MRLSLSGLVLATLLAGCAGQATTGAFTQVGRIESELRRGVSTKMDVRRVLGTPKGVGAASLPTDPRPRELWYYEDVKVTDVKFIGPGEISGKVQQQILLVTFDKGVFDGFIWYSGAPALAGQ
jgi:hypothetical protein